MSGAAQAAAVEGHRGDAVDQSSGTDPGVHDAPVRHGGRVGRTGRARGRSIGTSPAPCGPESAAASYLVAISLTAGYHVPRNDRLAGFESSSREAAALLVHLSLAVDLRQPRPNGGLHARRRRLHPLGSLVLTVEFGGAAWSDEGWPRTRRPSARPSFATGGTTSGSSCPTTSSPRSIEANGCRSSSRSTAVISTATRSPRWAASPCSRSTPRPAPQPAVAPATRSRCASTSTMRRGSSRSPTIWRPSSMPTLRRRRRGRS